MECNPIDRIQLQYVFKVIVWRNKINFVTTRVKKHLDLLISAKKINAYKLIKLRCHLVI